MKFNLPKQTVFLFLIILLASILRFWNFTGNPPGLYWDEVSNGYNAYSILKTARDEYGKFLPTTFRAYDDYRPAFAVYPLVPSIAIFGLNEASVRLPSVIFGILSVLLTYLIVVKLSNNQKLSLLSALLLAISPWHIHLTRAQFEAGYMVFASMTGFYFFLLGLKNFKWMPVSAFLFGISAHSYQGGKVWIPLFLLIITVFYFGQIIKYKWKLFIPLTILAIFGFVYLLDFKNSLIRGKSVSILSEKGSKYELFIKNYLSYYSPNFLFTLGDQMGRHSVPGMGEEYVFEIPLITLGLVVLISQKEKWKKFLLAWVLIAPIAASTSLPSPHALRSLTFIPAFSIIGALGILRLKNLIQNGKFGILIFAGLLLLGFYNMVTYLHLYHIHYPKVNGLDWQEGHREMYSEIKNQYQTYDAINITSIYGRPYMFTLFYLAFDPKAYQAQSENKSKFDKFNFFPPVMSEGNRTLYVITQGNAPERKLIKTIKSKGGETVFEIRE